jgi:hypothetical protein
MENALFIKKSALKNNEKENKIHKNLNFSHLNFLTAINVLKNENLIISYFNKDEIFVIIYEYPDYEKTNFIKIDNKFHFETIKFIYELPNKNIILQSTKNCLYFLNESDLKINSYLIFENLFKIFITKEDYFFVLIKEDSFYILYKYINNIKKSEIKLINNIEIFDVFYFENLNCFILYDKYSESEIINQIYKYDLKTKKFELKQINKEYKNIIQLNNQLFLIDEFLIEIFDIEKFNIISNFVGSFNFIDIKLLSSNILIALNENHKLIFLEYKSMKEISRKNFIKIKSIFVYENKIFYLKENNEMEIINKESLNINNNEITICSICLTEIKDDNKTSILNCEHMFHNNCITQWLILHNYCPICKLVEPKKINFNE